MWFNLLVYGIAGSFIASVVFLVFLFTLRPKIAISPKIALSYEKDEPRYSIKIKNQSLIFKIFDIHAELVIIRPYGAEGGQNVKLKKLKLKNEHIWYAARRPFTKSKHASYAIIWTCIQDINEIKKEGDIIHFKIFAKHALSGFPKVATRKYHHENEIQRGSFCYGKSFEIH